MRDDFGTPALVVATLEGGREVKIAYGSVIRVRTDRADQSPQLDTSFSATDAGTPEARIVGVGQRHLDDVELTAACARLSHGLNLRSGAHLEDILGVAERLYLLHEDNEGALQALGLLTNLPWDGAVGRWKSIQAGLGLASQILREEGDHITAENLGARLREADEVPSEPGRAARVLEVRQRQLDAPQLYEREVSKALQARDQEAEYRWRRDQIEKDVQQWIDAFGEEHRILVMSVHQHDPAHGRRRGRDPCRCCFDRAHQYRQPPKLICCSIR